MKKQTILAEYLNGNNFMLLFEKKLNRKHIYMLCDNILCINDLQKKTCSGSN